MIVTLVADREEFAADRRAVLDRADADLEPAVRSALARYGSDEKWYEPLRDAALALWDATVAHEFPSPSPVVDDARAAFSTVLDESLAKTSEPTDPPSKAQVDLITKWLSTLTVNDATATAASADTETDLTLEWVTMHDSDVRASHRAADGQTIPVGGTFEVEGHDLHYPGEPVGPPNIWINCRCVVRIGLEETMDEETLAALTAAAESEETDADAPEVPDDFDMGPVPWHGVLTVEGLPTGDGRKFTAGSLTWVDLPTNLRWQIADAERHDGSVIVGRIDNIWRDEASGEIRAEGVFHDGEDAVKAMDLIGQQMLRGVSVDIDDAVMELQNEDGTPFDMESFEMGDPEPMQVLTEGRIRSAALCSIQAFVEAYVALGPWGESPVPEEEIAEDESLAAAATFAPGTKDGPGWITHPRATQRITNYWVHGPGAAKIGWGTPNDFYRCRRQLSKYVKNPEWLSGLCANLHKRALGIWPGEHASTESPTVANAEVNLVDDCEDCLTALIASAGPDPFPHEWFLDPKLTGPTPMTITEDGRVFGHLGVFGTCHIGYGEMCMDVPRSKSDYAYFHQSGVVVTDAGDLPIGKITMGTGHASMRGSANATLAHYDNTGTAAAYVRAGEDEFGVWIAGVVDPWMDERQRFTLKAAGISGDWREINRSLELVAALAVNVPGFPIPRPALAASGARQTALVASGMVLTRGGTETDLRSVVRETLAQMKAEDNRKTRAAAARAVLRSQRAAAAKAKVGVL